MMIALLAALVMAPPQQADSVRLCLRDAVTGTGVVGATLRVGDGAPRIVAAACDMVVRGATVYVTRVGYVPRTLTDVGADNAERVLYLSMVPRVASTADAEAPTVLTTQYVTASMPAPSRVGSLSVTLGADEARERGAQSMNTLIGLLPFTALRTARGESGLSLRGARREQVVITLDGLPLNDPATGLADVADLPLATLQSATVLPGADPVQAGSGAAGGVLALTSAASRLLSLRTGAFGEQAAEGAWTTAARGGRWNVSLAHRRARNDFTFLNEAGAAPTRERRVNNDDVRTVVSTGVVTTGSQWHLLASIGERGMVGAANVRAFDDDRARTSRLALRGQSALGRTLVTTGVRLFSLAYRDLGTPALDTRASAWAADVDWRGAMPRVPGRTNPAGVGTWRLGAGRDALTGTGNVRQHRARAFAAWNWQSAAGLHQRVAFDLGARTDVIERSGTQPTASAGVTWRAWGAARASSLSIMGRVAQAVRVPTLYDLYFSSPQRLTVRALAPERVPIDASSGVQGVWQRPRWRLTAEAQAVARDTRDAIVWFPGNFGWSPANVGRERLRGTESRIAVTSSTLSLGAWHTWYRSELTSGTLRIPTPYVPAHAAAISGAWRMRGHTLSSQLRWQGRRPFTAGPRNPAFELPAVALTDIAWSHRRALSHVDALLSFTLENATNVAWQSVRGFPMPGRGWSAALTLSPRP